MKRIIITCILILTAGLCLAPVLFLLVGTFMGNHEIYTCIAPALEREMGLLSGIFCHNTRRCRMLWSFFSIHQNIFRCSGTRFLHGGNSGRADAFWHAGSVGAGAVFFPRKKNSLPAVHSRDDDAVSGHDVVAVSGVKPSGNAGQTAGSRFARNFATFSVFIMYRFFRGIPENVMEAARMDGAENSRFFCGSAYRLKSGHPVGTGIFVFGLF